MSKMIGILTSGGDSPGLNAAIRGIGKALLGRYGMKVIGFRDGFRGMMENRTQLLDSEALSGILTLGGTILGTSRDKPYAMPVAGRLRDMTDVIVDNYRRHHLDALVCLGGGGTQKNAYHLMKQGLNVITLPKTIDNDVVLTDVSFGYDTALGIATEAVDRLHSTAHSHHRILVLELMGNKAGWLALGAGIAGGADVILIPEIPYDVKQVAAAILRRSHSGQGFSIVAVAEGAISREVAAKLDGAGKEARGARRKHKNSRTRRGLPDASRAIACIWPNSWKNSPVWNHASRFWVTCSAGEHLRREIVCWPHAWVQPVPTSSIKAFSALWWRHGVMASSRYRSRTSSANARRCRWIMTGSRAPAVCIPVLAIDLLGNLSRQERAGQ